MSRLDEELNFALRRVEPLPGFAGRVLARVEARRNSRRWWTAAIAAGLMLAGGLEFERERRIRAQGEQAKQQVMLALRITGSKLQLIKEKIHVTGTTRH